MWGGAVSYPINERKSKRLPGQLFSFALRVVRGFMRNQGLLLSGGIAYYTLLSIIPMSILAVIGLSHVVKEDSLFQTLSAYVGMVMPGYASILNQQVRVFLNTHRHAVGIIGVLAMLFFRRHGLRGASKRPVGDLCSSGQNSAPQLSRFRCHSLCVCPFNRPGYSAGLVYYGSVGNTRKSAVGALWMELQSSTYFQGRAVYRWGHVRGAYAHLSLSVHARSPRQISSCADWRDNRDILWEITRRGLIWYYSTLSMVNLIYGSFATPVVALLTAEAIALIVLLGAQVIAELERKTI